MNFMFIYWNHKNRINPMQLADLLTKALREINASDTKEVPTVTAVPYYLAIAISSEIIDTTTANKLWNDYAINDCNNSLLEDDIVLSKKYEEK